MDWDYPQPFILPVMPQAGDIDGLNHTNNAVYVRWCEQAGWAHSEGLGLSLDDYRRLEEKFGKEKVQALLALLDELSATQP